MLRATLGLRAGASIRNNSMLNMQQGDMRKRRVKINREIGMWLYKEKTMRSFMDWCAHSHVKARGRVRITSSQDYARCLRTTGVGAPGEALVTAPFATGFNFLVVSRLMFETSHQFPLQIDWMNWNERLRFLPGAATNELVAAGWIARLASEDEDASAWTRYATWLLEDTSGRDGIANAIHKERGDHNQAFDDAISGMAFDSGVEAEEFIELVFRAIGCLMLRAVPVDLRAIRQYLPGTTLYKVDATELFVPTLIPLVDCCPQKEDGMHTATVDFFTTDELQTQGRGLCADLGIDVADVDERVIGDKGMYALRCISELPVGEYVSIRGWPKTPQSENERMQGGLVEQMRQQNNELL